MPKLPFPPAAADLAKLRPEVHVVPLGAQLWRIYPRAGEYPVRWSTFRTYGPIGSRFDPHTPPARVQTRGVLYAAVEGDICFAEYFQLARVIDRVRNAPALAGFVVTRDVRLLDLTGLWCTRAGASMAINTGPHRVSAMWARAIYDAYPDLDGLWYASSMYANRPAQALFERAADALPTDPEIDRALADPEMDDLVANVAHDIGYDVEPRAS